jgi:pimeloyl-ACP methyl ester carboxylesterase
MKKLGPAIWLGHSLAGTTGARLSNDNPEYFRAVIGIEPQGACNMPPETPIKGMAKVPQFSIHGINQVGRPGHRALFGNLREDQGGGRGCNLLVTAEVAAEPFVRPYSTSGNLGQRPYHDVEQQ